MSDVSAAGRSPQHGTTSASSAGAHAVCMPPTQMLVWWAKKCRQLRASCRRRPVRLPPPRHEPRTMRGGKQPEASTVTIAARGELAEPAARAELIALIGARP